MGLVLLSVDVNEDPKTVKTFVEEQGLTFPILLDPGAQIARQYQVRGVPSTFFISPDGVILDIHIGPMDKTKVEEYMSMPW